MTGQQYPTREQIALVISSFNHGSEVPWPADLKIADAVLALFPQPTPSVQPEEEEVPPCPECGGLGYDVDWADPPSQGPCGSCGGSGNLDPSTIRDVTEPATPEVH